MSDRPGGGKGKLHAEHGNELWVLAEQVSQPGGVACRSYGRRAQSQHPVEVGESKVAFVISDIIHRQNRLLFHWNSRKKLKFEISSLEDP